MYKFLCVYGASLIGWDDVYRVMHVDSLLWDKQKKEQLFVTLIISHSLTLEPVRSSIRSECQNPTTFLPVNGMIFCPQKKDILQSGDFFLFF